MKTTRLLLLCLVAAVCGCTSAPAQTKALTKTIATDTLTEGFTVGGNQTLTISANATLALPDNALQIADTSGLQAALDSRQPLDSDLTSIASLSTTGFGRSALTLADAAAGRDLILAAPRVSPTFTGNVTVPSSIFFDFTTARLRVLAASGQVAFKQFLTGSLTDDSGNLSFNLPTSTSARLVFDASAFTGSHVLTSPSASGTLALTSDITAANLSGTVPVAKGGTGQTTLTSGSLLTGNATGPLTLIAPGTSGNVLTSNGTAWLSSAPTGGNITINATAPLTVNGNATATTSNATLAVASATSGAVGVVRLATDSQALQLTSNSTVISPAQAFMASLGMMRIDLNLAHPNTSTANAGSGTSAFAAFDAQINTVSGGTSYARRSLLNRIAVSGDGGAVNFDKPIGFQLILEPRSITTNGYFRFTLTGPTLDTDAVATVARPTQKAIGIYILNGVVFGVVHDGTMRTETSLGISVTTGNFKHNNITCLRTASGSYQFFVNGVSGGTLTGGPTGLSSTQWSADYLCWHFAASSGGDAGATNYFVRQAFLLHAQ